MPRVWRLPSFLSLHNLSNNPYNITVETIRLVMKRALIFYSCAEIVVVMAGTKTLHLHAVRGAVVDCLIAVKPYT